MITIILWNRKTNFKLKTISKFHFGNFETFTLIQEIAKKMIRFFVINSKSGIIKKIKKSNIR